MDGRPRPDSPYRLVAVTGRPATGKTTLSTALAERCRLPLIRRDVFKEAAFDALGCGDVDWSSRVGALAYEVQRHAIDLLLRGGGRFLVDTTLTATAADGINELLATHRAEAVQVLLTVPGEIRLARMRERIAAGTRHPGHADELRLADPGVLARIRNPPTSYPRLRGRLLVLDGTGPPDRLADAVVAELRR